MPTFGSEPLETFTIAIVEGADTTIPCTWNAGGTGVDFTGSTARIELTDDCGNVTQVISTTATPYGVIYLGTVATSDAGVMNFTFTKLFSQSQSQCGNNWRRQSWKFWVVWSDGTTTCVFAGPFQFLPGSPY